MTGAYGAGRPRLREHPGMPLASQSSVVASTYALVAALVGCESSARQPQARQIAASAASTVTPAPSVEPSSALARAPVSVEAATRAPPTPTSPSLTAERLEPLLEPPADALTAACARLCRRTTELGCGATEQQCVAKCGPMVQLPVCSAAMQAFFQCVDREPTAHWECDAEHMASIKEGYCETEQRDFTDCVRQALSGG